MGYCYHVVTDEVCVSCQIRSDNHYSTPITCLAVSWDTYPGHSVIVSGKIHFAEKESLLSSCPNFTCMTLLQLLGIVMMTVNPCLPL